MRFFGWHNVWSETNYLCIQDKWRSFLSTVQFILLSHFSKKIESNIFWPFTCLPPPPYELENLLFKTGFFCPIKRERLYGDRAGEGNFAKIYTPVCSWYTKLQNHKSPLFLLVMILLLFCVLCDAQKNILIYIFKLW